MERLVCFLLFCVLCALSRLFSRGYSFRAGDHLIRRPLDCVLKFHHFLFVRIKIHFPGQLTGLFFEFSRLRRNLFQSASEKSVPD